MLWSFNGPEPGGPESTVRKWENETNILWFMQRTNKTLEQGLHHSRRHRAPSRGGLESLGMKWARLVSTLQRINQRERERERRTRGPRFWWNKGALLNSVWVYILLYKVAFSAKIKIKRPDLQVTNETRSKRGHKARDNPYQKKESCKESLSLYGKLMKEMHACIPSHDLSPRSSVPLCSPLLPGTDKEQRAHARQKTAHKNPTVKHSLTLYTVTNFRP